MLSTLLALLTAGLVTLCDFDSRQLGWESLSLEISEVANPERKGINPSKRCAVTTSGGEKWESVFTVPLSRALDFTAHPPVFSIKVLPPRAGLVVRFSIKQMKAGQSAECPTLWKETRTTKAGEWEELSFDFSDLSPKSNWYRKIVLYFDAGGTSSGESWFFDDLQVPDDDLTPLNLFRSVSDEPLFDVDPAFPWRSRSITSGRILTPRQSPDGKWHWYNRGSGKAHQTIGMFVQDSAKFDPIKGWKDYPGNPVLDVGRGADFDAWRILGVCPVPMPDHSLYFYYKARPYNQGNTFGTGLAYSTDGVHFDKLTDHSLSERNPADAVFHEGKFYLFIGPWLVITDDPLRIPLEEKIRILNAGDGPACFDRTCLFGNRVFRLEGVDKWFMVYHGDASHPDFPHRFHIALSDDLVHWTKVGNPQPLFSRGPRGRWDQGGIWAPEIIEYRGTLYMYYEGWGEAEEVPDRDKEYFRPAASRTGVAVCDKNAFLKWCGLQ